MIHNISNAQAQRVAAVCGGHVSPEYVQSNFRRFSSSEEAMDYWDDKLRDIEW